MVMSGRHIASTTLRISFGVLIAPGWVSVGSGLFGIPQCSCWNRIFFLAILAAVVRYPRSLNVLCIMLLHIVLILA
jgi:hypothetical protein